MSDQCSNQNVVSFTRTPHGYLKQCLTNIETQNCVPSQQEFNETSPDLVSKRTRAFTPDEESQDSDSEYPSTRQTKEKN
ncbi:11917_t:CDS:1, partial [Ambispora gerdemannii]